MDPTQGSNVNPIPGNNGGYGGAANGVPRTTQPVTPPMTENGGTMQPPPVTTMSTQQSNPLQPNYIPNPTMGQATLFQGAQLDPNIMNALGPNSTIAAILQGFAPQAQQANTNLMDTLAAAGIAGGPAAGLQMQLQGNLASSLAPTIANAIQNSQGNQLQAALANAGFSQQAGLANQGASNQMTDFNIGNLMQQMMANTGYANQGQDTLANALLNAYGMNFNAFNNLNNAGLQGVQNLSATNMGAAGNMANTMANNFPVYQSMWPQLAQAAASYYGAGG